MAQGTPDSTEDDAFVDGDRPGDSLLGALWDLRQKARERAPEPTDAIQADVEATGAVSVPVGVTGDLWGTGAEQGELQAQPVRDRPIEARMRAAARDIVQQSEAAGFESFAICASNEFPSQLTRLPIFRPSQRAKQQSIQDLDNAIAFETPWGRGRRLGPPLTVRDEDTLIALMRLRDRVLRGPEKRLPDNVRDIYRSDSGTSEVHRVVCSLHQLLEELKLSDSGTNFKNLLASIKRLAGASVEIERVNLKEGSNAGGTFHLIQLRWLTYEEHGLVDVIFPPMMAHWLRHSYTYIDWSVRLQLSPLSKAVHRFLSGQRTQYTIELAKLANTIGFDGRREHMKRKLSGALDELVETGWMSCYRIRGTGRGQSPWMLDITRA